MPHTGRDVTGQSYRPIACESHPMARCGASFLVPKTTTKCHHDPTATTSAEAARNRPRLQNQARCAGRDQSCARHHRVGCPLNNRPLSICGAHSGIQSANSSTPTGCQYALIYKSPDPETRGTHSPPYAKLPAHFLHRALLPQPGPTRIPQTSRHLGHLRTFSSSQILPCLTTP